MDLKKTGWEEMEWIHMVQDWGKWQVAANVTINIMGFIQRKELLDRLRNN